MQVPSFITVRTTSSRLPGKCLLPFGETTVIGHVVGRAKFFGLEPIICTTSSPADDMLAEIAAKEGIKCFRGSELNKLKRWLDCCCYFNIPAFHTVDADDPFFDGDLVKKSFALLSQGYDVVSPTEASGMGNASVGYSLTKDIVEKACALAKSEDTEMMWYYLDKVPGIKKIQLADKNSSDLRIRLTLDYEEDYWLLSTVRRLLGGNATRKEVDELFRRNPDLYKINWFRNQEWKDAQLAKKV
jgi:spore coat polysaccharide biosynthesis protein SpsF